MILRKLNKGKNMKKIILASVVTSSILMAGGYKIPESSVNAVALSAANVAHTTGADAAYYNPANMIFMADEHSLELDITYISLDALNYQGNYTSKLSGATTTHNINSKEETFYIPTFHYVSPKIGEARVGFSMVTPGGLSKRWDTQPAQGSAEEFTLETIELSPTVALPVGSNIAIAAGIRVLYSKGIAKASAPGIMKQDMSGDSIDFGYNLALAYKPNSALDIGVTYRSQINMTLDGDANLYFKGGTYANGTIPTVADRTYKGAVTLPLPAALNLAAAYTFSSDTTIEFVYERNFWSEYKNLDFNYKDPYAEGVFGNAKPKNWDDSNIYRLGLTQVLGDATIMAGFVYEKSPTPTKTVGFELPDSDQTSVSLGGRYAINKSIDFALAGLYSMREARTITAADANDNGLVGTFAESNVLIISAGVGYKF